MVFLSENCINLPILLIRKNALGVHLSCHKHGGLIQLFILKFLLIIKTTSEPMLHIALVAAILPVAVAIYFKGFSTVWTLIFVDGFRFTISRWHSTIYSAASEQKRSSFCRPLCTIGFPQHSQTDCSSAGTSAVSFAVTLFLRQKDLMVFCDMPVCCAIFIYPAPCFRSAQICAF